MKGMGFRLVRLASWRTLLVMALTMGVLGMQSGRGTLAYFTDSMTSTQNTLVAGTLKLKVDGTTTSPYTQTWNTVLTKLKPGTTLYAYVTVENDNSTNDAVTGYINTNGNNQVTVTRTQVAPAASSDALDTRVNILTRDVTGVAPFNAGTPDSTTCASNPATGTLQTASAGLNNGATASANGLGRASGSAIQLFTNAVNPFNAGAIQQYCIQMQWVDGTSGAALTADNNAKQGQDQYAFTWNVTSTP
jgi:predicted ribosomally synthesized peptide with SipW-like signal peptide